MINRNEEHALYNQEIKKYLCIFGNAAAWYLFWSSERYSIMARLYGCNKREINAAKWEAADENNAIYAAMLEILNGEEMNSWNREEIIVAIRPRGGWWPCREGEGSGAVWCSNQLIIINQIVSWSRGRHVWATWEARIMTPWGNKLFGNKELMTISEIWGRKWRRQLNIGGGGRKYYKSKSKMACKPKRKRQSEIENEIMSIWNTELSLLSLIDMKWNQLYKISRYDRNEWYL